MNIHKTKIEWCSHTWNPVTGCRHDCPYCYARRIATRFGPKIDEFPDESGITAFVNEGADCYVVEKPTELKDWQGNYRRSTPYPKNFAPTLHKYTLTYPEKRLTPATIFVGSMADLFGRWVPDDWIEQVFDACRPGPEAHLPVPHQEPAAVLRPRQRRETPHGAELLVRNHHHRPGYAFFLLGQGKHLRERRAPFGAIRHRGHRRRNPFERVGWVIIGAMTGPGSRKQQPKREWVKAIVNKAREAGTAVFMKDSLKPIWGDDILREHPPGMIGGDNSG